MPHTSATVPLQPLQTRLIASSLGHPITNKEKNMTVSTTTKVFGIDQIMLYPITQDTPDTYSVGEGVDLPGAKSLEVTLQIDEKNLSGNEVILDVYSKVKKLTFSATFAKMGLELLKATLGGFLSQNTNKSGFSLQNGQNPPYFQLVAKVSGTDEGSLFLHLMKCKVNAIPIKAAESDFATFSLSGSGIYTTKKFTKNDVTAELLMDIVINDTPLEIVPNLN
jgi:hypothetical protein